MRVKVVGGVIVWQAVDGFVMDGGKVFEIVVRGGTGTGGPAVVGAVEGDVEDDTHPGLGRQLDRETCWWNDHGVAIGARAEGFYLQGDELRGGRGVGDDFVLRAAVLDDDDGFDELALGRPEVTVFGATMPRVARSCVSAARVKTARKMRQKSETKNFISCFCSPVQLRGGRGDGWLGDEDAEAVARLGGRCGYDW